MIGILVISWVGFVSANLSTTSEPEVTTTTYSSVTQKQKDILNLIIKKIQDEYTTIQQEQLIPSLLALMEWYRAKLTWNKLELAELMIQKLHELQNALHYIHEEDGLNTQILAQCLTDAGMKLFSTERCSHCKNQKAMFGPNVSLLNNTDCDEDRQTCIDNGIQWFPTWIDSSWTAYPGTQSLTSLAEISWCKQ